MIKLMVKVFIRIWMEQDIEVSGKMISNMVMGKKSGLIKQFIRVIIIMEKSKEKGIFYGQIALLIMDNSLIIISMELELISGLMAENIQVIGKIIKCMG